MSSPTPHPDPSDGSHARLTLTPRTAVLLAAAVVLVAVVVVLVGAIRSGGGSAARVTVTVAPSVGAAGAAPDTGPSVLPSAATTAPPGGGPSGGPAGLVLVHVVGAVRRAGVVELAAGSRVTDALERAGGATGDADLVRLNLARPVVDGERIYVPEAGETTPPAVLDGAGGAAPAGGAGPSGGGPGTTGQADADTVVDLNAADQATLETLPGIGPSLAARIIAWREEHGRFTTVDDLL